MLLPEGKQTALTSHRGKTLPPWEGERPTRPAVPGGWPPFIFLGSYEGTPGGRGQKGKQVQREGLRFNPCGKGSRATRRCQINSDLNISSEKRLSWQIKHLKIVNSPAGQQGLLQGSRGSEKTPVPPTSSFLAIPCWGTGLCLAQLLCWVVAQVYICFVRWPMTVHSV